MKHCLLFLFGALALLASCTTMPPTTGSGGQQAAVVAKDSITGTVAYRERMALSPTAVVRLQLQDVSRQDAAAVVIDSVTLRPQGRQVPLAFILRFDPTRIQENMTYALQARIEDGGQLLFVSDVSYPVLTRGNPRQVQMMLRRASR
ncbi:YbaY family lipoprotein [Hymenobacter guriensis]|uniref:YbaY family lipoprotein n=1 Tax=Hymenobacter guriensis TaxID=2793065 RepID=A0ABS0L6C2_9BACT|nr:YbaY family lipoprotein [Hymenobacter guriensis]MBG8555700.1 YbaY family lipoprotein [Hymenobacter guriensis]